jgi:hypothetical protein
VKVIAVKVTVQVFFTVNFATPVVLGDLVTAVGIARIVALGGVHVAANSGRSSVGDGSFSEQASAAGSSRQNIVRGRIVASFW